MIRMTRGSFAFVGGENGRENPKAISIEKTPKDGPFSILDNDCRTGAEREAQLVAAGVAEYVGDQPKEEIPEEEPTESAIPTENPEEEKPKTTRKRTRR